MSKGKGKVTTSLEFQYPDCSKCWKLQYLGRCNEPCLQFMEAVIARALDYRDRDRLGASGFGSSSPACLEGL